MNIYHSMKPLLASRSPPRLYTLISPRIFGSKFYSEIASCKKTRDPITIKNDNGRIPWQELSLKERVARSSKQTFNLSIIVLGATLSAAVSYILYTEVFSPDSPTSHFNQAFGRVINDPRCIKLLGEPGEISAYGEKIHNSRRRSQPFVSTLRTDEHRVNHLLFHFTVKGPKASGIVYVHMIKRPSEKKFDYKYLALDVAGKNRIYLEDSDEKLKGPATKVFKLFGVTWR